MRTARFCSSVGGVSTQPPWMHILPRRQTLLPHCGQTNYLWKHYLAPNFSTGNLEIEHLRVSLQYERPCLQLSDLCRHTEMVLLDHLTTLQMNEKFWQESKFVHPETEFLVHLSGMLSFESGWSSRVSGRQL